MYLLNFKSRNLEAKENPWPNIKIRFRKDEFNLGNILTTATADAKSRWWGAVSMIIKCNCCILFIRYQPPILDAYNHADIYLVLSAARPTLNSRR